MNRAGYQFFAYAALAGDQDGGICPCDSRGFFENSLHRLGRHNNGHAEEVQLTSGLCGYVPIDARWTRERSACFGLGHFVTFPAKPYNWNVCVL